MSCFTETFWTGLETLGIAQNTNNEDEKSKTMSKMASISWGLPVDFTWAMLQIAVIRLLSICGIRLLTIKSSGSFQPIAPSHNIILRPFHALVSSLQNVFSLPLMKEQNELVFLPRTGLQSSLSRVFRASSLLIVWGLLMCSAQETFILFVSFRPA